ELFNQLALLTDLKLASLYGVWRTPVPTTQPDKFGTDVLMSSRDSVLQIEYESHLTSGNLIGIILIEGEGVTNKMFSVRSTDGGLNWYEKTFIVSGSAFQSISAAMLNDYCYVTYIHNNAIKVMRYRWDTGHKEDWSAGVFELTLHYGDFGDVKIVTNDDYAGTNYLYVVIRHLTRELTLYRFDPTAQTAFGLNTSITDCDRGLDVVASHSDWFPVFISYYSQSNIMKICRYELTQSRFVQVYSNGVPNSTPDATAIGLYGIDIICVYETYYSTASTTFFMGAYSDDIGVNWGTQAVTASDANRYEPDLTMRDGGGVALAYGKRTTFTKVGRYKWRPYDNPSLASASPTAYADHWITGSSDIEYIGAGEHGIAYISSTDYRQAWFDKGSMCCANRGDIDHSGGSTPIDISDLVYLVDYMFTGGYAPPCFTEGDVDGSSVAPIDISDLVYLVDYMFTGGPPPPACT
ncbi:MAG: hypothetical protein OEV80_15100, partial [candidate division Zixibacteria bacterium]|nr:hypothetical protein [candidate division Zixibacteria bacterium]